MSTEQCFCNQNRCNGANLFAYPTVTLISALVFQVILVIGKSD